MTSARLRRLRRCLSPLPPTGNTKRPHSHELQRTTRGKQQLHCTWSAARASVQRLVVRLIDAPLPIRPRFNQPTGTIVITDDRLGTARELADRLAELDVKTVLVRMGEARDGFAADLTDPAAVTALLTRIREKCGPVSGLIHLLPLAEPPVGETAEQRMRRGSEIALYLLARTGLETGHSRSWRGKTGSAVLLTVTAMGGTMGFGDDLPADFFAGHGGIAGFTKCLGFEWPEVTVRVVDVSSEVPAPRLVEQLLGELGDPDGPFEVGRDGDRRVTWQVDPGPLAKGKPSVTIDANSTVLITGGARGITAKVALEIASRYKSKLVLVGSSPVPAAEHTDTAALHAASGNQGRSSEATSRCEARGGGSSVQAAAQGSRDPSQFGCHP